MPGRVGIGIVTYNRRDLVRETIRSVRQYTRRNDVDFVVADDGSTDDTLAILREEDMPVVTGVNMGVAWNKNRALYLLAQIRRCEVVILLEDDTMPTRLGWEDAWVAAALRWGHVNYAGNWIAPHFVSGAGTVEDPVMALQASAQCAAWSRDALDLAGYFDSSFRGYGHEHVEQTRRLIRIGYGGTEPIIDGKEQVRFALIKSDIAVHPSVSTLNEQQVARNLERAHRAMANTLPRAPWRDFQELRQFRSEINTALAARPAGFALRGPASRPPRRAGFLARLFGHRTR